MYKCCPTCGQTLPPDKPLGLELRGHQLTIANLLLKAGPHGLDTDVLFARLYENDPNGGPLTGKKILSVLVNQLNKRLALVGKKIKATSYGPGPCSYVMKDLFL